MANKSVTDQYKSRIASLNKTVAKNASKGVANQHKSLVSSLNKTVATRGTARKAGTITNNAPKAFVNSKTPTMSSYASKSGATRKKPY